MMRFAVSDERGETCVAVIDERERRTMSLKLDDAEAQRTFVGLNVLTACVAAILEDVKRGGMTMEGAARKYEAEAEAAAVKKREAVA